MVVVVGGGGGGGGVEYDCVSVDCTVSVGKNVLAGKSCLKVGRIHGFRRDNFESKRRWDYLHK